MSEFSTKAMVDLEVSEKSLRDARSTIQNRVGSVRADGGRSSPASTARDSKFISDRASRERAMTRNLLTAQLESLGDIKELLQKQGVSAAQDGGGGAGSSILQGLGVRSLLGGGASGGSLLAAGALAAPASVLGLNGQVGEFSNEEIMNSPLKNVPMGRQLGLGASILTGGARAAGLGPQIDALEKRFAQSADLLKNPPKLGVPEIPKLKLPGPQDVPQLKLPGQEAVPQLNLPSNDLIPTLKVPGPQDLPKLTLTLPAQLRRFLGPNSDNTSTQSTGDGGGGPAADIRPNIDLSGISINVPDLERQLEDALSGGQVDIERLVERKITEQFRGL